MSVMAFAVPPIPTAIILLVAGLLACFLGYRLFRWMLLIYGFAGGAFLTSLVVGEMEPWIATLIIVGGGVAGALLLRLVYLAVLALLGAGLGAMAISLFATQDSGDAEVWVVVVACLIGAIAAVTLQRYVIIVGTSFGGAWAAVIGALALGGDANAAAAAGGELTRMYPMAPAFGQTPFAIGWLSLAVVAALIQLRGLTMSRRRRALGG